jgi:hypothetical protein
MDVGMQTAGTQQTFRDVLVTILYEIKKEVQGKRMKGVEWIHLNQQHTPVIKVII